MAGAPGTALAAGQRPCAQCRNADFKRWQQAWATAHGEPANAAALDARLHEDRLDGRAKRTFSAPADQLPTGTMVLSDGAPWLVHRDRARAWTPAGYTESRPLDDHDSLTVLTPECAVNTLAAGYAPELHPTAVPAVA